MEIPGGPLCADVVGSGGHVWFPGWEPAGGEDFERDEEDREGRWNAPTEAPADPSGRIVNRLRELHELGGDPAYERFPASEELFRVLEHAQTWAGKLKQPDDSLVNVVGEAAVLRAKLWQYLREQADAGQLKAVEDGRAAGVPWDHFTEALYVTSKQGAYQKARRLKAEQLRDPGERRTPETAREHEDRNAAEQRAERALMLVQERRFLVAQQIGRLLLERRDGIVLDSWATFWWSGSRSPCRAAWSGREFAGALFTRHAMHHEVDRARVGVRVNLAVVDHADHRPPDGVVHDVLDDVPGPGGERVRFHRPPRALGLAGDEHSLMRHGLPVCLMDRAPCALGGLPAAAWRARWLAALRRAARCCPARLR
ncbi:hypothetical protein ACWD26_07985 [Streptomyces sp. NPDC002787]